MKFILLPLLLLSYGIVYAQSNLQPGYIITHENDTVAGWVDYRTDRMNALLCTFKKDETSPVQTYSPKDIAGFRFTENGKYYVSREIMLDGVSQLIFLEYLVKGMMNLYFYADKKSGLDYYIFEDTDGSLHYVTKRPDWTGIIDDRMVQKPDIRYKNNVWIIFRQIPELREKISDGNFTHESMMNITKDYHQLACTTGEPCIEFESTPDRHYQKVKFSAYGGISFLKIGGRSFTCPTIGVQMNISMPKASKALSLLFDISMTGYPFSEFNTVQPIGYSLMAGGRYTGQQGGVRPFVEAGIGCSYWNYEIKMNYAEDLALGLYGVVGLNFKVGQDSFIFLSTGFSYSFTLFKRVPPPRLIFGYTF